MERLQREVSQKEQELLDEAAMAARTSNHLYLFAYFVGG